MEKHRVTLELDEETWRQLDQLGEPVDVLAALAASAARGARLAGLRHAKTDESLRIERTSVDSRLETVRLAAEQVLERQRSDQLLSKERDTTNQDLRGERLNAERALGDLREANSQMVLTTLGAQESAEEAGAAQARAEARADELRAVARLREMFIGVLGHDLRTPLGAISICADALLRGGRLGEDDERRVRRIIESGQRMARMITQLLDVTRARLGGGLTLERVDTDLREVCDRAAAEFEAPVKLELAGDLRGTWDADRLAEALANLLGNALEYRAPGTQVRLAARAEPDWVIVEVSNQGPPIPPDVLPGLFEPFRRAKQLEKSPTGNLGLGLYITRQIALAHGGSIEARSAEGTTTFALRLPRAPPKPGG